MVCKASLADWRNYWAITSMLIIIILTTIGLGVLIMGFFDIKLPFIADLHSDNKKADKFQ
jgi:hypothetical protein